MSLLKFSEIELRVCFINQTPSGTSKLKKILDEWQTLHNAIQIKTSPSQLAELKTLVPQKRHLDNIKKFLNSDGYILTPEHPNFPNQLKLSKYCPPILYWQGQKPQAHNSYFSVVGTREADAPALSFTHQITKELINLGHSITSGMAYGVDQAAHQACLDNDQPTFAVLGQGLLFYNPDTHCTRLFERIKQTGAILSPFPLHTPPSKNTFPQRNRIISGMSKATLLIQSKEKGGSMITANLCKAEDKPLFVMPDHPLKKNSKGGLQLISEGAHLALSGAQIQNTLLWHTTQTQRHLIPKTKITTHPVAKENKEATSQEDLFTPKPHQKLSHPKQTLIKLLSSAKTLEELQQLTHFPQDVLFGELCELEITNIIQRDSSMNYQIKV